LKLALLVTTLSLNYIATESGLSTSVLRHLTYLNSKLLHFPHFLRNKLPGPCNLCCSRRSSSLSEIMMWSSLSLHF